MWYFATILQGQGAVPALLGRVVLCYTKDRGPCGALLHQRQGTVWYFATHQRQGGVPALLGRVVLCYSKDREPCLRYWVGIIRTLTSHVLLVLPCFAWCNHTATHYYKEYEMNALNQTWDLLLARAYNDGGGENSTRVDGQKGWDMQPPLYSTPPIVASLPFFKMVPNNLELSCVLKLRAQHVSNPE